MQKQDHWINNAKIYQVFIDRFAGFKEDYTETELKSGFLGGNLKALIHKLDYIKGLNFNTIWLTPFNVNQAKGYHGYHIVNYMHVDPRFAYGQNPPDSDLGDNMNPNDDQVNTASDKVLIELIGEIHKRGMKLIADFVPNHCHESHPYFQEALKSKNSPYRNWFYFTKKESAEKEESKSKDEDIEEKAKDLPKEEKVEKESYLQFLFISELPKFNLDHKECGDYMIRVAKRWLKLGIDSLRIDHVVGPSREYMKRFNLEIKHEYPTCLLIGECIPLKISAYGPSILGVSKENLLALEEVSLKSIKVLDEVMLEYEGIIDGLLDFSFSFYIEFYLTKDLTLEQMETQIKEHYLRFKDSKLILAKLLDSHDDDRILFKCNDNISLLMQVLSYLYKTYENRSDPLIIYYGTEDFMTQAKTMRDLEPYGDFRVRQPMRYGFDAMKKLLSN